MKKAHHVQLCDKYPKLPPIVIGQVALAGMLRALRTGVANLLGPIAVIAIGTRLVACIYRV